ncbi:hypothetical protein ANCCAN_17631 [Ancylostoma caninum]|uniref:Uncharacterized protein n=1 Tax=Ancylostoma caninum TaxID=29170 RepID=A0A368G1J7_ANCCA|nr:hypothetical protein ANCCAN_17631 [Ancylostoma caninum]
MFIYGLRAILMAYYQSLTAFFKRNNVPAQRAIVVADALSRGVATSISVESLEVADKEVVNSIRAREDPIHERIHRDSRFTSRRYSHSERGELEQLITTPREKRVRRVADFVIEKRELRMYAKGGSLVSVVPKPFQYKLFHDADSELFAGHFNAYKSLNRLKEEVSGG